MRPSLPPTGAPCVLWSIDKSMAVRFSHENEDVKVLYREYLKAPLGEKSHHLLHTDHHGWQMPGRSGK